MTKKVFYEKIGKKFIAVSEYSNEWVDSIPYDCCILELKKEHSTMRRYKVEPALAPMVAAAMVLEDELTKILSEASKFATDEQKTLTPEQKEMWDKLNLTIAYGPSYRDIAEKICKALATEAEKLLTNDALREQYEHFLLLAKLSEKKDG